MPKRSKLLSALDRQKGRNFKLEKQRKLEKAAAARKGSTKNALEELENKELTDVKGGEEDDNEEWEDEEHSSENEEVITGDSVAQNGRAPSSVSHNEQLNGAEPGSDDGDEDDDEEEDDDESGGIPLSDIESLGSDDKADIIPHQRLTINNTSALLAAHKSIALPKSLPFSANQTITSSTQVEIKDVHDDPTRERAFYRQALEAAVMGRERLTAEGVPFTRPNDYFAEMVKTDEHMGKIKAKMVEEASNKKAAAEARKQRDLKKFGKSVQVAKLQERDKAKRETLEKINILKRKRKDKDSGETNEADMFDIALDNEIKKPDRGPKRGKDGKANPKRQKKDAKFGFGGKKRFAKSGDAISSGDMKGFSTKKMKGAKKTARPGKSKRAKKL